MTSKMFKLLLVYKPRSLERRLHTTKDNAGGIYSALRNTLLCTRLLGLLPLSGLSSPTSDKLRFTFKSPYTMIYVISMFGQWLMFCMAFYWLLQNGISLSNITNFFFYSSSLTSSIILMNISRHWPQVMLAVESIEVTLPPFKSNITKVCNIIMVLVLTAAVVEHVLSLYFGFTVAYSCGSENVVETFFRSSMPWIFDYMTYSLWKGILSEIFNIQSTFIWSFNDLLIMVLSIYLTEHVVVHNALLRRAVDQEHFSAMEFRIHYLNIVRLVRLINGRVGIYILTSFGSNLYWICTQLFNSLNNTETGHFIACYDEKPDHYLLFSMYHVGVTRLMYVIWSLALNILKMIKKEPVAPQASNTNNRIEHTVYFTYSFSFIVLRTLLVLLLASRIHSNSKVPLIYLHGLPSEKFDVEVERFIAQVNNIKVALSGLDFFYVTRTMILTLLGTIATYELVMLQFNK